jgi:Spy/CpxP family protein refolding chaperone
MIGYLYTTLRSGDGTETDCLHIGRTGNLARQEVLSMALSKLVLALAAGSIALGAGGAAFARSGGDPAKFGQRIEKRVERALKGTDVTDEQKKKVTDIIKAGFADLRPLRAKAKEGFKAMTEAMQAPTIDKGKIETIRTEQMKVADDSSRRLTKALTDAGEVLSQSQRQTFFKKWEERHGKRGG